MPSRRIIYSNFPIPAYSTVLLTCQQEFLPELAAPLYNIAEIASDFSKTYRELALNPGLNLRAGIVELSGYNDVSHKPVPGYANRGPVRLRVSPRSTWPVPDNLKTETVESLFDWVVAECIVFVIETYLSHHSHTVAEEISRDGLPLRVTCSFPIIQTTVHCWVTVVARIIGRPASQLLSPSKFLGLICWPGPSMKRLFIVTSPEHIHSLVVTEAALLAAEIPFPH